MRPRNARHEQVAGDLGGRLSAKEPEAPVETAEVRRMYAFANTVDPRLIKLLKLVEQVRTDRLRQGRFF